MIVVYKKHFGACRNENDQYDDKGKLVGDSLIACKQKCDETQGCGALSWSVKFEICYMTSDMVSTTSESAWECYAKGCSKILPIYDVDYIKYS